MTTVDRLKKQWDELFEREPDPHKYRLKPPYIEQTVAFARKAAPIELFADLTANIGADLLTAWLPTIQSDSKNIKAVAYEIETNTAVKLALKCREAKQKVKVLNSSAYAFMRDFKDAKESIGAYVDFPWHLQEDEKDLAKCTMEVPAQDKAHPKGTLFCFLVQLLQMKQVKWVVFKSPNDVDSRSVMCNLRAFVPNRTLKFDWQSIYGSRGDPAYVLCRIDLS